MSKSSATSNEPKNFRERTIKPKAFTLFEIIIAMLVVGIISALAAPKVIDLVNEARRGDELNTVGNVRSGIALTYLGNVTRGITPQYPQNLDNAAIAKASSSNPLYNLVLQHGITKGWEKLQPLRYRGPTGQEYEYDPTGGSFEPVEPLPLTIPPFTAIFGGSNQEEASSILLTPDGGYIIAGYTASYGAGLRDFYLVKTDAYGNKLWEKTYGGVGLEWVESIQNTSDGGYIMAGGTNSFGAGQGDFYLVKIDSSGNKLWEKTYGDQYNDLAYSVQEASGGGYIISGESQTYLSGAFSRDAYIVKTDSSGNKLWEQIWGGTSTEYLKSVQNTSDGGYIMSGTTYSSGAGNGDFYLVKIDSSGNKLWETTYGGANIDDATSAQNTPDGGYIITGSTRSYGAGSSDIYLVKVDSSGTMQWQKTYGGGDKDTASEIQLTSDGGYVIVGTTPGGGADSGDVYLVKTDSSGNKLWERTYDRNSYESGTSVQQTPDGGYVISATTNTSAGDIWLIKTDANGNIQL